MKRGFNRPRRAFATATALTLLAFVAVLLAAMGSGIGLDARRTRAAVDQTQLRQLLHAAALAAAEESLDVGTTDLPLPRNLADDSARLTITIAHPSSSLRTATIEATIAAHQSRQVVHFARRGDSWSLNAAALDPPE